MSVIMKVVDRFPDLTFICFTKKCVCDSSGENSIVHTDGTIIWENSRDIVIVYWDSLPSEPYIVGSSIFKKVYPSSFRWFAKIVSSRLEPIEEEIAVVFMAATIHNK